MAITTPLHRSSDDDNNSPLGEHPMPPTAVLTGFDRDAEEAAARPLLARANLLRMRGQWDEAIAVCTEALRRAPHSSSAHSLLGDVYEAQNKPDEAVQWFGMACDLDPTNQTDRAKLDRALALQNAKLLAEQKASGFIAPPPVHKPATEKTLEWIDRILPPGKSESVARLIFGLSGIIALMIVIAAGFLWQTGRTANTLPVVESLPGHGTDTNLPPLSSVPPVVVAPPAANAGATQTRLVPPAAPVPTPPGTVSAVAPTAAITPTSAFSADAAPIAPRFAGLLAANAQVAPTLRLQGAQIDAAQNVVRLDVAAQIVPGEAVGQTRERVLRAAVLAVRAAGEANLRVGQATVRVLLTGSGTNGGGAASPIPDAFVGTLPLSVARDMDVWGSPSADLLSRFTSLQWSPQLSGVASTSPAAASTIAAASVPPAFSPSSGASVSKP